MGMLSEKLPETVIIGGTEISINTDFRTSILFEELLNDPELSDYQKITQAVELYFGKQKVRWEDRVEAIERILEFYTGGGAKATKPADIDEEPDEADALFSYEYDGDKIYAAFEHDYGIDLQSVDYLHWWKFKALFRGLSEDNEIMKIIGYRGMTIDPKMTSSQKEFYRKMKRIHALPAKQAETEFLDGVTEALMNGGSLKEFLERNGSVE